MTVLCPITSSRVGDGNCNYSHHGILNNLRPRRVKYSRAASSEVPANFLTRVSGESLPFHLKFMCLMSL